MNEYRIYLLLLILPLLFAGCKTSIFTITPEGDRAEITFQDLPPVTAELLAIDEPKNLLYIEIPENNSKDTARADGIAAIDLNLIETVTIKDYVNKSWVTPWITLQVAPTILFTIAASQEGMAGQAFLAFGIPTASSGLLLSLSEPDPPTFGSGLSSADTVKKLTKYTRFPLGLNDEQLRLLLDKRNQQELTVLGVKQPLE